MARENYFDKGDHFSEFHRKWEGLAYVDCDAIEICQKCSEPLCVMETCFDKGQTFKTTTVTEKIARALMVPGYLVFYRLGKDEQIDRFRVTKLVPEKSKEYLLKPMDFVEILQRLQERHICGVPF